MEQAECVSDAGSGQWYGRYQVIDHIASGGMAQVYLCRVGKKAGFHRLFALKVLHPHLNDEHELVAMLKDEARIASQIHHVNVVSTFDIGRQHGNYYIVLEYVEGFSLRELLHRCAYHRDRLSLTLRVVLDALKGLQAAHAAVDDEGNPLGLVHRDMSPDNILVGTDGLGRITDFGIATARSRITKTSPGTLKGKIGYIAPEQVTGQPVDHRADIFAMGVVLWTAMTGERPFAGGGSADLFKALTVKPPAPSTVGRRPPAALDAVALKALGLTPDERYASADEMAEALTRTCEEHQIPIASADEVAAWVKTLFGTVLEHRRQRLRETPDEEPAPVTRFPLLEATAPDLLRFSESSGEPSLLSELESKVRAQPDRMRYARYTLAVLLVVTLGKALVPRFRAEPAAAAVPTASALEAIDALERRVMARRKTSPAFADPAPSPPPSRADARGAIPARHKPALPTNERERERERKRTLGNAMAPVAPKGPAATLHEPAQEAVTAPTPERPPSVHGELEANPYVPGA